MPVFPQSGQSHQPQLGQRNRIGLFPGRGFLPLVKVIHGHEAAPPLECLAERRLTFDPLGFGVDVRETNFEILSPERYQAPAHDVQAALTSLRIISYHRERVGWRYVPTRRYVRGRPMRRDREDELDLAGIGGKANTATHGRQTPAGHT